MYQKINEASAFLKNKIASTPDIAIILGSGFGQFAEELENKLVIPYTEIPHFTATTVVGHKGAFIYGTLANKKIAVFQGRFHAYEGHPLSQVTLPTRVIAKLGIKNLILTNASGGINSSFKPGDLVYITDHINLTGQNPLIGLNMEEYGPRFPDMSDAYSKKFIEIIKASGASLNYQIKGGVYAGVLGPSYETPAEIKMLKTVGADLVGMSTVPEAIVAAHSGLNVAGIACVTNYAAGIVDEKLSHSDVEKVAKTAMANFSNLVKKIIEQI